jgi:hypothetical protein
MRRTGVTQSVTRTRHPQLELGLILLLLEKFAQLVADLIFILVARHFSLYPWCVLGGKFQLRNALFQFQNRPRCGCKKSGDRNNLIRSVGNITRAHQLVRDAVAVVAPGEGNEQHVAEQDDGETFEQLDLKVVKCEPLNELGDEFGWLIRLRIVVLVTLLLEVRRLETEELRAQRQELV